jgi:hypothetical protein
MFWGFLYSFGIQVIYLLFVLVAFWVVLVHQCSDGETHFNGIKKEEDEKFTDKLFNRLYFSMVTVTTLGYGDVSPKSKKARSITMGFLLLMFLGIFGIFTEIRIHNAIESIQPVQSTGY